MLKKQSAAIYASNLQPCFLQRNSSLPDDTNVARLQEELIAVKLREAEALTGLKELRQQVRDLEDHWQVSARRQRVIHALAWRHAVDNLTDPPFTFFPQRHLARTAGRWKDNQRKNTLSELQDELMSVRLREAEAQAELRENRQRLMEMETQVRAHTSSLTLFHLFMRSDLSHSPSKFKANLKVVLCVGLHGYLIL